MRCIALQSIASRAPQSAGSVVPEAAMVITSRLMLQALPGPGRLLPNLHLHATTGSLPAFIARGVSSSCVQANCVKLGGTPGAWRDWRVLANPRVSRETVCGAPASGRTLRCCVVSSSAMAGRCSDPPPMYRANVGVALINDKNEVSAPAGGFQAYSTIANCLLSYCVESSF